MTRFLVRIDVSYLDEDEAFRWMDGDLPRGCLVVPGLAPAGIEIWSVRAPSPRAAAAKALNHALDSDVPIEILGVTEEGGF